MKGRCDDRLPHPLVRPPKQLQDPERIAIRDALALAKAVYDQRCALDLSISDLARRMDVTPDEIGCIEEGPAEPAIALLRRLAAALDADVRLTAGHDLGFILFELTEPEVSATSHPHNAASRARRQRRS
jgi:transcriptional regulator with XRE-family HTH domain